MKIYLVGGAVRDELLGYPTEEYDYVVVGATPTVMEEKGYSPVGKDFPVFLHPKTKDEYALARTERKSGRGYKGFAINADASVTLEEDLIRRDLTINAIAKSAEGEFIDPYGGREDIQRKLLRHVSDAFREDPVRILRIARFASRYHHLGFTIAPETLSLMREMVNAGEADHLVAERTWKEFSRALGERSPHIFVDVLNNCGALHRVMPEIADLVTSQQNTNANPLAILRKASTLIKDPLRRLATMLHDLVPTAVKTGESKQIANNVELSDPYSNELMLLNTLSDRLCLPNDYKELCSVVIRFNALFKNIRQHSAQDILEKLKKMDAFRKPERFYAYLDCCEAYLLSYELQDFDNHKKNKAIFSEFRDKAADVSARSLMAEGITGKQLGEAIDQERIRLINDAIQQYQ